MKALKTIGIIVIILVALFFIVALFLPSKFHYEKSITINRQPAVIFKQVNNFHNWGPWSPWAAADSAMKSTFEGPVLGEGAKMSWISPQMGNGSMTITESIPYKSVKYQLDFEGQGSAVSDFNFTPEGDSSTQVTWSMDIPDLKYPMGRFMGMIMKPALEKSFTDGLTRLKEITESMPNAPKLELTQLDEIKAITVTDSCNWDQMGNKMDEMFGELMGFLAKHKNVAMAGHPFTIYHRWDEKDHFSVFEDGIPVDREVKTSGRIQFKDIPAVQALKGTYFGPYDAMAGMYNSMDEFVKEFGLKTNGGPIEMYITDPTLEPDTAKWETDIYFPIEK
jgi:effector-binding domain-containing protein